MDSTTENPLGKTIGGYTVGRQIADGGMGAIYQAFHPNTTELLAIKVLLPAYAADDEFRKRFKREAAVMRQLEHPNIIPVYASGEDQGYLYFVMHLVRGTTLYDLMFKRRFSPLSVWQILNPIASALDYAHERGVIHRDIKPGNILIEVPPGTEGSRNHIFLADFGLSKVADWSRLTQTGMSVGTPQYMSPEQVMDFPLTPASDVYSLAVVVYELLLGRLPFYAKRPEKLAFKHVDEKPPAPTNLHPDFPKALESILLRALDKDPLKRFSTAGEFGHAYAEAVKRLSSDERSYEYFVGPPSQTK